MTKKEHSEHSCVIGMTSEEIADVPWHPAWWRVKDILKQDLLDEFPHCKSELVKYLGAAADEIEAANFCN
jgi:hypothetical protein